jgi:hypothetical protein
LSADRREKFTKSARPNSNDSRASAHPASLVKAAASDAVSDKKRARAFAWLMFCF